MGWADSRGVAVEGDGIERGVAGKGGRGSLACDGEERD